MAQNNNPMPSAQVEKTQGNPPRPMSFESYILQIQNFLSSIVHQMSELRQSQSALEAGVISLQNETHRPDERQGEPSFVVEGGCIEIEYLFEYSSCVFSHSLFVSPVYTA